MSDSSSEFLDQSGDGSEKSAKSDGTEKMPKSRDDKTIVDHDDPTLPINHPAVSESKRYRPLSFHARGGLGEVHKAEDTSLHRQVALKRLRKEHAQRLTSRKRFLVEAEVTARLEHPGIVPIYSLIEEEDGQLGYTMRFIEGQTLQEAIDDFHDKDNSKRTPADQRMIFRGLVRRLIDVCNTMAYVHSRGIIHRDLKPGNIMLGKYGETLIVDWGLAKPFGEDDSAIESQEESLRPQMADPEIETIQGQAVGTPAYMPPEQAAGRWDLLDDRGDIYSLGAILYAMLTGVSPFKGGSVKAILNKVEAGDFVPPRKKNPETPQPLDAICLKAMALKPDNRYHSVLMLKSDLENFLADEAVIAYHESFIGKFLRWSRHHSTLLSTMGALLVTASLGLLVGLIAVNQERKRTVENKQLADNRTRIAVETLAKVVLDLQNKLKEVPATRRFRERWLQDALVHLKELGRDISSKGQAGRTGLAAHLDIGNIFLQAGGEGLKEGKKETQWGEEAKYHFDKALVLAQQLQQQNPESIQSNLDLSVAHERLGELHVYLGHPQQARTHYEKSLSICEQLKQSHPEDTIILRDLAISHDKLGDLLLQQSQPQTALEQFQKALKIRRSLATQPQITDLDRELAVSFQKLGDVNLRLSEARVAREHYRQALNILERQAKKEEQNVVYQRDLSVCYNKLGEVSLALEDDKEAFRFYSDAHLIAQKLRNQDPESLQAQRDLSVTFENLGDVEIARANFNKAKEHYSKSLELSRAIVDGDASNMRALRDLSVCLEKLGNLSFAEGDLKQARSHFREAFQLRKKLAQADAVNIEANFDLVVALFNLGSVEQEERKYPTAFSWHEQALTRLKAIKQSGKVVEFQKYQNWEELLQGEQTFCVDMQKTLLNLDYALELPIARKERVLLTTMHIQTDRGKVNEVIRIADALAHLKVSGFRHLYNAACGYALGAKLVKENTQLQQVYGKKAVELLQKAIKVGDIDLEILKTDKDLDSIRQREDFQKLIEGNPKRK